MPNLYGVHVKGEDSPHDVIAKLKLQSDVRILSFEDFADGFLAKILGMKLEDVRNDTLMSSYLGNEWSYIREERFVKNGKTERKPVTYYLTPKTIRKKLVDALRTIHSAFLINATMNEYNPEMKWVVIINNINEFTAIKDFGGDNILVEENKRWNSQLESISKMFDIRVNNLAELQQTLKARLSHEKTK